jgi:hypothetical protein
MEAKKKKDAPAKAEAPAAEDRGPIKVLRIDDVSVSIFARQRQLRGEMVSFYSTSFSRSYKDSSGSWKYTKNFDVEDLGKLVTLAQQASEYIHGLQHPEADPHA